MTIILAWALLLFNPLASAVLSRFPLDRTGCNVQIGKRNLSLPPSVSGPVDQCHGYYYALGHQSALTEDTRKHRVDGEGITHIFHLPSGPDALIVPARLNGTRRASLSALKKLTYGMKLAGLPFPKFIQSKSYSESLTDEHLAMEASIAKMVTATEVMKRLKKLVALPDPDQPTRSYQNEEATKAVQEFLRAEFQAMNLQTCIQTFKRSKQTFRNVVAYVPGTDRTAGSITVGAHYDSRPFQGKAPGAIDNGSGVASMLVIARMFARAKIVPKHSVYFVGFAAEEIGLWGSAQFAKALKAHTLPEKCMSKTKTSKKSMHTALILDEVAWKSPLEEKFIVNMESFDWSDSVLNNLGRASEVLNGDQLEVVHSSDPFGSDHMSFLDNGMPAVLTIHGDDDKYPNYHQSTDTINNANPKLLQMITKMNLGGLLRLCGISSYDTKNFGPDSKTSEPITRPDSKTSEPK